MVFFVCFVMWFVMVGVFDIFGMLDDVVCVMVMVDMEWIVVGCFVEYGNFVDIEWFDVVFGMFVLEVF